MGFYKYVNGAWQEADAAYRYYNGAWIECGAAYRYNNGAWGESWTAAETLDWYFTNNNRDYSDDVSETALSITCNAGSAEYLYVVADGNFTNPTITFDWGGGAYTGSGYAKAGSVYAVGIDSSGNETTSSCGNLGSSSDDTGDSESITLSGTFTEVGVKVIFMNCSSQGSSYLQYVDISNITINGKAATFK